MLSMPRLIKLAESEQHDRLLEETLRNGRPLPLGARLRFSDADALPVAALSLALSRITELTHRPTAGAQLIAGKLLALQNHRGAFGPPALTASAVEALAAILDQDRCVTKGLDPTFRQRIELAHDRGIHTLYAQQFCQNTYDALIGDAMETALILWRLGAREAFDAAISASTLRRALEEALNLAPDPDVSAVMSMCPDRSVTPLAA